MKLEDSIVSMDTPIKDALSILEKTEKKTIFIVNIQNQLIGLVNDGDIRRALLNGISEDRPVYRITNCNPITDIETAKQRIKKTDARYIVVPILNKDQQIIDCTVVTQKTQTPFTSSPPKFKRVLVVGGAGYLGSVLCRKLLNKEYKVRVLDSLLYGDAGIRDLYKNPDFEFIYGDMRNLQVLVNAISDVDAVIHLAAIVGDPASALNPSETIQTNCLATKMVAEVCKFMHINKLIFASTCSVYGASKDKQLLYEHSRLNPVSLYARMKIRSEETLTEMQNESFRPVIFRMGTLHGLSPRMRFDLAANIMTIKAIHHHKFMVYGGSQYRAFLHVEDAADAYIRCLETPHSSINHSIYNLVSENLTIKQLASSITSLINNVKVKTEDVTDKRNYMVSGLRANTTFCLKPKRTVKHTIASIAENADRYKDFENKKYSNIKYLSES